MKKVDLKCNGCGAPMQLSEDKTYAECPYCKNKVLLKNELSLEEQTKRAEELSYAKEKGEIRANEEALKKQKRQKRRAVFIVIFILVGLGVFSLLSTYYSKELIEDPFKCINIKISGIDGQGKVDTIDNETCPYYSDIEYYIANNGKLKENQTINITVMSEKYRFDKYSKEYTVTGLSKYLKNLDQLSNEAITQLHRYSETHLRDDITNGISFSGELVNLTPYKLYLYSNGSSKNILYDVYKATIKTSSGKKFDKYVVAYYENFLILNTKELFSYSRQWHCGNSIAAGDPKVYTANGKDYAGFMTGFLNIEDFKSYINKKNDGSFEITEK